MDDVFLKLNHLQHECGPVCSRVGSFEMRVLIILSCLVIFLYAITGKPLHTQAILMPPGLT